MSEFFWGALELVRPATDHGERPDVVERYEGHVSSFDKACELWRIVGRPQRAEAIERILNRAALSALTSLTTLKQNQHRVDKAPEVCRAANTERNSYLNFDHRGAGREAVQQADRISKEVLAKLVGATDNLGAVESMARAASVSVSEEPWRRLATAMSSSAAEMQTHYARAIVAAKDACAEVVELERWSKDKLKGQCTKREMSKLDEKVDVNCHGGQKRSCAPDKVDHKDCSTLKERLAANQACVAARLDIKVWCVDSDAGHDERILKDQRTLEICEQRVNSEC